MTLQFPGQPVTDHQAPSLEGAGALTFTPRPGPLEVPLFLPGDSLHLWYRPLLCPLAMLSENPNEENPSLLLRPLAIRRVSLGGHAYWANHTTHCEYEQPRVEALCLPQLLGLQAALHLWQTCLIPFSNYKNTKAHLESRGR